MLTGAIALNKPNRGIDVPTGRVVFGTDFTIGSKNVTLEGVKTVFPATQAVAWRVTLPTTSGGEAVSVTVTAKGGAKTVVDEFVAKPGWNVFYGKSDLASEAGTYTLHYLVDGVETGSGTFKVKTAAN